MFAIDLHISKRNMFIVPSSLTLHAMCIVHGTGDITGTKPGPTAHEKSPGMRPCSHSNLFLWYIVDACMHAGRQAWIDMDISMDRLIARSMHRWIDW